MMKRELSSFEKAIILTNDYAPLNVVSVLQLSELPKPEVLNEAFQTLQKRHPLLRAHVSRYRSRDYFEIGDPGEFKITFQDRKDESHYLNAVEDELNQPIRVSYRPLIRCTCLQSKETKGPAEIILTFQHAIMDGVSGTNLLHELMQTCRMLELGESHLDHQPLPLFPSPDDMYPPKFKSPRVFGRKILYLIRQLNDELWFRWNSRHHHHPGVSKSGMNRVIPMVFDPGLTDGLIHHARQKRITLNCLINAALMTALNDVRYQNNLAFIQTISLADLRQYLEPPVPPENLGCYVSMQRFTVPTPQSNDVWDTALQLQTRIELANRRGEKFLAPLLSPMLMKTLIRSNSLRMASTAISYSGAVQIDRTFGPYKVLGLHGFISATPIGPEFSAEAHIFDDRLNLDFLYWDADFDSIKAQEIADRTRRILLDAVGPYDPDEPALRHPFK